MIEMDPRGNLYAQGLTFSTRGEESLAESKRP